MGMGGRAVNRLHVVGCSCGSTSDEKLADVNVVGVGRYSVDVMVCSLPTDWVIVPNCANIEALWTYNNRSVAFECAFRA